MRLRGLLAISPFLVLIFSLPVAQGQKSSDTDVVAVEVLTDREVALGVETELLSSEAVASHKIDAVSDRGIVTLSGKVDNLRARRAAFKIAQRVKGVRSVINQIVVITGDRDDEKIATDLRDAFAADETLEKTDVTAGVEYAAATLKGTVESEAERALAGRIARGVKGLVEVKNEIEVDRPAQRPDPEIQEELERLFRSDAVLSDAQIDVTVKDANVVLTGDVPTSFAKSRAENLASMAGVDSVDARGVQIDYDRYDGTRRRTRLEQVSDDDVVDTVQLALRYDPRVLSYLETIDVASEGGTVTLSGTVGRLQAKESAEETARGTLGVWRVKNHLKVRWPDETPSAGKIIDFVQAAFLRDPYVSRHELRVHCRNGHVSLYGLVDTKFEKQAAGWIAGEQKGVVHVNNYLSVAKEWTPKSDAEIKADIEDKLKRTFFDRSNDIRVTVEDGVAILNGKVDTWRQWQTALDLVVEAGARRPHNLLKVRYHPRHGGDEIYVPR